MPKWLKFDAHSSSHPKFLAAGPWGKMVVNAIWELAKSLDLDDGDVTEVWNPYILARHTLLDQEGDVGMSLVEEGMRRAVDARLIDVVRVRATGGATKTPPIRAGFLSSNLAQLGTRGTRGTWTGDGRGMDEVWTGDGRGMDEVWTGDGRGMDEVWTGDGRGMDKNGRGMDENGRPMDAEWTPDGRVMDGGMDEVWTGDGRSMDARWTPSVNQNGTKVDNKGSKNGGWEVRVFIHNWGKYQSGASQKKQAEKAIVDPPLARAGARAHDRAREGGGDQARAHVQRERERKEREREREGEESSLPPSDFVKSLGRLIQKSHPGASTSDADERQAAEAVTQGVDLAEVLAVAKWAIDESPPWRNGHHWRKTLTSASRVWGNLGELRSQFANRAGARASPAGSPKRSRLRKKILTTGEKNEHNRRTGEKT